MPPFIMILTGMPQGRARPISLLIIHNRATYKSTWILSTISACILYLWDIFSLPLSFQNC